MSPGITKENNQNGLRPNREKGGGLLFRLAGDDHNVIVGGGAAMEPCVPKARESAAMENMNAVRYAIGFYSFRKKAKKREKTEIIWPRQKRK